MMKLLPIDVSPTRGYRRCTRSSATVLDGGHAAATGHRGGPHQIRVRSAPVEASCAAATVASMFTGCKRPGDGAERLVLVWMRSVTRLG